MEAGKDISVSYGKTTIIHQNIPGSELPTHSHDTAEIIFPLNGDLTVSMDKTHNLKYGQMIYIPKDCEHSFSSSEKFGERLILLTSVGEGDIGEPRVFPASRILIDFSVMLVTSETAVPEHCVATLEYLIKEALRASFGTQNLSSIVSMVKDERLKKAVT